jgi:carboxylesterase type B
VNTPEQLQIQYQGFYNNLTAAVGCNQSTDSVACLRTAPFEKLYNACTAFRMTPVVDGEFITQLPSESIQKGEVADVAVIIGTNTDEGTAYFLGPRLDPLENDTDVANFLKNLGGAIVTELDSKAISTLMELYPDDPAEGCPFGTGPERFADQGYMFKRGAALAGDVQMHAGRRYYADWHAAHQKQPVYTYRFDQAPWNMQEIAIMIVPPVYVTHFSEVCICLLLLSAGCFIKCANC